MNTSLQEIQITKCIYDIVGTLQNNIKV